MFSGCTVLPDSKETELGNSNQEASRSEGKNNRVVLVPCSHIEVHPYSYFWWCGYFRGAWVSFFMTDEFSLRVTTITYLQDWCLMNSQLSVFKIEKHKFFFYLL